MFSYIFNTLTVSCFGLISVITRQLVFEVCCLNSAVELDPVFDERKMAVVIYRFRCLK